MLVTTLLVSGCIRWKRVLRERFRKRLHGDSFVIDCSVDRYSKKNSAKWCWIFFWSCSLTLRERFRVCTNRSAFPLGGGMVWCTADVLDAISFHELLEFIRSKLRTIVWNNLFQNSVPCKHDSEYFDGFGWWCIDDIISTSGHLEWGSTITMEVSPRKGPAKLICIRFHGWSGQIHGWRGA
jgi:hypothetical protein